MAQDPGPHPLAETFLIIAPGGEAATKRFSPSFYEELGTEFDGFRDHLLVSRHSFAEPWSSWEMHPKGDEFVYLLEGDTDFVLRTGDGERVIRVSEPGAYVVVPRGAWHTARPHRPTTMLFVTPGEGTENRETPPL